MAKIMDRLNSSFSQWYDGLTDRERKLVTIFGAVLVLGVIFGTFFIASHKLESKKEQLLKSRNQYSQVRLLEGEFLVEKKKNEMLVRSIRTNTISLFSLIPGITQKLGMPVKGLDEVRRPEPKTGMVEVSVKLNLTKLSIDKLSALIDAIESSNSMGLVKVTRLKISKNYSEPDYLDVQMTVATWKTA